MCLHFFLSFYFCTHFDGEQGAGHFNCFAGVFWLLVFHDSFSWFLGLVCRLWLKQFLIILPSSFYIYKSIKYSGRLVLREELFKETQPWRTLDIIQKYDRPLLDLFQFTELSLCCLEFTFIWFKMHSYLRGSKTDLCKPVCLLHSPYNACYFRKGESLSGNVFSST